MVTVTGRIRIAWRWFWRFLFLVFLILFIFIAFISFGFNVIDVIIWIRCILASRFNAILIIWRIIFAQWRAWRWWVWLWVRWCVWFSFSLWWIRWSCCRICWSCQWHGVWCFVPTGIESIGDVLPLVMYVPKVVDSKGGWLIEIFWRPKSWFSLLVSK